MCTPPGSGRQREHCVELTDAAAERSAITASDLNKRSGAQHEGQVEEKPTPTDRAEALKAELDELLDEIDEVLENNAMEFERYDVQRRSG